MFRVLALLLAIGTAAGPSLLDRCLVSCHDEGGTASDVPSCHDHSASGPETSLRGLTACDHDHESQPADTVGDGGSARSSRHVAVSAATEPAYSLDLPVAQGLAAVRGVVLMAGQPAPTHAQLRL